MASGALKQRSVYAAEEPARSALRAGSTVAYSYRVIRELATGGMSQLYLVEHLPSSSYAALKVAVRPSCEVLAREYALLKRVACANVVRAFEHGRLRDSRQYLVLELLPGADLQAWLSAYGRLAPQHALSVLWQLSAAVDHLHAQGVVPAIGIASVRQGEEVGAYGIEVEEDSAAARNVGHPPAEAACVVPVAV